MNSLFLSVRHFVFRLGNNVFMLFVSVVSCFRPVLFGCFIFLYVCSIVNAKA